MHPRILLIFGILSSLATGCVVDNPLAYDQCKTNKDCTTTYADTCLAVSQNWGGSNGIVYDALCTTTCTGDLGCSLSQNGLNGFCSTATILGVPAGNCFERCYYDSDCSTGFVCAGAKDVFNLPAKELICVPQPATPVYKAAYTTCSGNSQCDAATPYCTTLDPKWLSTTNSAQLAICTAGCTQDSDCPVSGNGSPGYCPPADEISVGRACVERCSAQADCLPGFLCAYMNGVVGLPNSTDAICLPDPG